jgi:exodeoxyribonuclease VII small subunit
MPNDAPPIADGDAPNTFEAALEALEARVRRLDEGDLPLEEALRLFEEGVTLQRRCQELLDATERRVIELTGSDSSPTESAFPSSTA